MKKLDARKPQTQISELPPELVSSRPRPVRLTGAGKLVAGIGVLLPVAALVSGFWLNALATRGDAPRGVPFWAGPVVAMSLALFAWVPWYALRRQWMLLAEGRPAAANVTRSKKVHSQHGAHYDVYYEFRTMSGAIRSGRYSSMKGPPPDGATICVVYDPDRPDRSACYPLALVRPA
jgi:hypothetical protein